MFYPLSRILRTVQDREEQGHTMLLKIDFFKRKNEKHTKPIMALGPIFLHLLWVSVQAEMVSLSSH